MGKPQTGAVRLGPRGGVDNHCKSVLTNLSNLCWEERLCDLTFICRADGTEIHAHVYLLSKVSGVIRQTATAAQLHNIHHGHLHITLEGIDSPTVGTLIEFLYLGETKMSEKASDNLYILCQMLAIDIDESKITIMNDDVPAQTEPKPGTSKGVKRPLSSPPSPRPTTTKKLSIPPSKSQVISSPRSQAVSSPKSQVITTKPIFSSGPKAVSQVPLYCYCRAPSSKDLIGCDFCPEWYHPRCLKISQAEAKKLVKLPTWKCPECVRKSSSPKSPNTNIEQLDGAESGFRLTSVKSDDESQDDGYRLGNKDIGVKLQPLEKVGEKQGLVPMDGTTWRVWHKAPPSPREGSPAASMAKQSTSVCTATQEPVPGDCSPPRKDDLKESKEAVKKMNQNRFRSRIKTQVKKEKQSFESTLIEIQSKEEEVLGIKPPENKVSSPSKTTGATPSKDVKVKKIVKPKGKRNVTPLQSVNGNKIKKETDDPKAKKIDTKRKVKEKFELIPKKKTKKEESAQKVGDKSVGVTEHRQLEMNWDVSEGEEVNRPVEDATEAKKQKEKSSSNDSGVYDELFFCYICKSIFVTKGALENHQKTGHNK